MISLAVAKAIKKKPDGNKEEKAEALTKTLLALVLCKSLSQAATGLMAVMDINNNYEAVVKVTVGQLQNILGNSNKKQRRSIRDWQGRKEE